MWASSPGAAACITALVLLSSGCATVDRRLFDFNLKLAKHVLEPMGRGYRAVTPKPAREVLRNFIDNLDYTDTLANNLFQAKWRHAYTDFQRLLLNTVFGFGGLLDLATREGLPRYDEDFGQTLGLWGVEEGPYFNIPFIGPSTFRDIWRYPFAFATRPFTYIDAMAVSLPVSALTYLLERWDQVHHIERIERTLDPYLFVKDAYLQRRLFLIDDESPVGEDADDEFDEMLDEALDGLEAFPQGSWESVP